MSESKGLLYLADNCQRLSQDLQGLAYGITSEAQSSQHQQIQTEAMTYSSRAGHAAKLRSQLNHTLRQMELMLYRCEEMQSRTGIEPPPGDS